MNITETAQQLADAIKNSREFMELKQAKSVIDSNIKLRGRIEEYKRKEQEIINLARNSMNIGSKADELNKMLDELSKIPEVSRFLKLEKDFNAFIQRAFKIVGDSIDYGLKSK